MESRCQQKKLYSRHDFMPGYSFFVIMCDTMYMLLIVDCAAPACCMKGLIELRVLGNAKPPYFTAPCVMPLMIHFCANR